MRRRFMLLTVLVMMIVPLAFHVNAVASEMVINQDTVLESALTGGDLTIYGSGKLTLKAGMEITGDLTIRGCEVEAFAPGIQVHGNIVIDHAVVTSQRLTYGSAIYADGGTITIKNSTVIARADDRGDNAVKASKTITATDSKFDLSTTGDISQCGLDGNDGVTVTGGRVKITTVGEGIASFGGSIVLNNVNGSIYSGDSGICSNKEKVELNNCNLDVTGGTKAAAAGMDGNGIWCYGSVLINGGSLKATCPRAEGIYANDKVELTSTTKRVEVTGKDNAIRVFVNTKTAGEIILNGLPIAEPSGAKVGENGYIIDQDGNAVTHVIIGDKDYVAPDVQDDPVPAKPILIGRLVLTRTSFVYNKKIQKPAVKTIGGKSLKAGTDYTVSIPESRNAGKYTVTVKGKGAYTGTAKASYSITKAANPLKISPKTATVKFSKLKKGKQVLAVSKVIYFSRKGQGTISYVKAGGSKNITIHKKTGKVTVKKGLKKGSYKVKVKVRAAGTTNYKPSAWKIVTFTVKVKK